MKWPSLFPPTGSGLSTLAILVIELVSDPLLALSILLLLWSELVLLDPSSKLVRPCLGGGGGGGSIEARLLAAFDADIGEGEMSILAILGGRPEILLLLPLTGGMGGKDGLISGT